MTVTAAPVPDLPAPDAPRRAAPAGAVAAAVGLGAAAALLVPGGPPGLGLSLLAVLGAAVLLGTTRTTTWQRVHLAAAVLLAGAAAVRSAPWVVGLDVLAALALGTLALVPVSTWTGVLTALLRPLLRGLPAAGWLLRGLHPLLLRSREAGAAARGAALTLLLLLLFVPLLASADTGFGDALSALAPRVQAVDLLVARLVLLVVVTAAVAACALVVLLPRPERAPSVPRVRLAQVSEWLPPLAALDLLLGAFLVVQGRPADDVATTPGATYAEGVHAGFWQLLAVTALVLAVVAAAARWAPGGPGVRAACGVLGVLALGVDASALLRLQAYTDAYGLTRLRVLVAVVCLLLAAVLLAVLVAGVVPAVARALPQAVPALAAAALLLLTAYDPDAAIARSAQDRAATADLAYLRTLSADAVPALDRLPEPVRSCALAEVAARRGPDRPWTSANLSRSRAADLLDRTDLLPCPTG